MSGKVSHSFHLYVIYRWMLFNHTFGTGFETVNQGRYFNTICIRSCEIDVFVDDIVHT